jgi:hypothetical protein
MPEVAQQFIQARNWKWANRGRVRLIVIHSMESPEKPGTARAVANWFAGKAAPMASAHVCVDRDEAIECVRPEHIAFAAPGANNDGLHIELAGRASQSADDWADEASRRTLELAARWAAAQAARWGVPVRQLSVGEILAGSAGFCGHRDITAAYHKSTHIDPGPNFPWLSFLGLVQAATEIQ